MRGRPRKQYGFCSLVLGLVFESSSKPAALRSQEDDPSKQKRIEDLQLEESRISLEERQLALDKQKAFLEYIRAMNSLKLREQEAELEERVLKRRKQEAELEERRASNSLKLREGEAELLSESESEETLSDHSLPLRA
ncbi:hypothetical protein EBZ37_11095, partial [bacterium]|nr:hypothetical protein [bacterium]